MSSYNLSITLDEQIIDKKFSLYTKLIKKENKIKINLGYILLDYVDDIYINLEIQYKYVYIKIYYNAKTVDDTFIFLLNNKKYDIHKDKLKIFLLKEIDRIDKTDFYNISSDLFIDSIEYWFNHSYCDDVFL